MMAGRNRQYKFPGMTLQDPTGIIVDYRRPSRKRRSKTKISIDEPVVKRVNLDTGLIIRDGSHRRIFD
jgi:hypothetical protein